MDIKESIVFNKVIAAGASEVLTERVKAAGTIEAVRITFAQGQRAELHVQPYIERKHNTEEPIITYPDGGQQYLAGDDIFLPFYVSRAVSLDDYVGIKVSNIGTSELTLFAIIDIDYLGGQNRVGG